MVTFWPKVNQIYADDPINVTALNDVIAAFV